MPVTLRFQSTGVVPGNARPVMVQGGSLTIGRGPDNDLVLPDPDRQISKRHCAIEDQGGDIVVIDFSSNGTFLNYGKVPLGRVPTPLNDGDILTMGPFELLVSVTPGAAPPRRDLIADPLPDPLGPGAGAAGGGLLPPLDDLPAAGRGGGGVDLPEAAGEVDFLDSLLGPDAPRGPSGVARPQPGDDGLLPPFGTDDPAPPAAPELSAAASRFERQEPFLDNFAPAAADSHIPDDWDDLLDDVAPPAA
ncbi:type VI secretion system-associated FHA domain protein, partial [Pseudogemmobacter humi]|uniref:type VI secretion system-associated FHA domain protein n=1 Tax=Pseudogemmobacter humi TaxID=2483812 RepID=UPI000F51EAE5